MSECVTGPRTGVRWNSVGNSGISCPTADSAVAAVRSWLESMPTGHDPGVDAPVLWLAQAPEAVPVQAIIADALDLYPELPMGTGDFAPLPHTLITVFADDTEVALIDAVHAELELEFLEHGAMLARPPLAPAPISVVRSIMTTDFAFLQDKPEWMNAYVRKFVPTAPAHVRRAMVGRLLSRPEDESGSPEPK